MAELPEQCQSCDKTCLGNCDHYSARETFFSDPKTVEMIYDFELGVS